MFEGGSSRRKRKRAPQPRAGERAREKYREIEEVSGQIVLRTPGVVSPSRDRAPSLELSNRVYKFSRVNKRFGCVDFNFSTFLGLSNSDGYTRMIRKLRQIKSL